MQLAGEGILNSDQEANKRIGPINTSILKHVCFNLFVHALEQDGSKDWRKKLDSTHAKMAGYITEKEHSIGEGSATEIGSPQIF